MKKILFILFIFFNFFFFLNKDLVYSQIPIPGVDCGNAEATGTAKLCCKKTIITMPALPDPVRAIPFTREFFDRMLNIQRSTDIVPCVIGYPSDPKKPNCECLKEDKIAPSPIEAVKKLCLAYLRGAEQTKCVNNCASKGGFWTAIGCVYGDVGNFIIEVIFGRGIGLAGTMALFCLIYSVFNLQKSEGNPEKIKKAQELLTSCIMGLMLIIFSVFILRLIGVDILKIPGFGTG